MRDVWDKKDHQGVLVDNNRPGPQLTEGMVLAGTVVDPKDSTFHTTHRSQKPLKPYEAP